MKRWLGAAALFILTTLAGHVLEVQADQVYDHYVKPHPALYWLGFLSSGWSRLAVWAVLFFGAFYLWDRRRSKKASTSPAEDLPAGRTPEEAVSVKLIPASGPAEVQLLEVKNLGARQTFRADCTLLRRRNDPNQLHCSTFRMEWDKPNGRTRAWLTHGGSRNLVVATASEVRGVDQGHPYQMEWIAITGLSDNGQRKEIQRSMWNHGDALPEYDLKVTITSGDQEPHVECFTLRAGRTSALEMFAIACEQPAPLRSSNVTKRDWIGEWGESKREFAQLEKSDVFAEFFQGNWAIRSDGDPLMRDRVEAACELAGARLMNSPGMSLSDTVRSQNEHWKRWLWFLKETQGLNRRISDLGSDSSGYIERLAQQSALACTKCAAKAFN